MAADAAGKLCAPARPLTRGRLMDRVSPGNREATAVARIGAKLCSAFVRPAPGSAASGVALGLRRVSRAGSLHGTGLLGRRLGRRAAHRGAAAWPLRPTSVSAARLTSLPLRRSRTASERRRESPRRRTRERCRRSTVGHAALRRHGCDARSEARWGRAAPCCETAADMSDEVASPKSRRIVIDGVDMRYSFGALRILSASVAMDALRRDKGRRPTTVQLRYSV